MANPIRVGIIGANPSGSWGATAHIPALRAIGGYEVTAVCTSSLESARASANHFGIRQEFSDPALLAACDDVDLVVVCVRVPEHDRLVRSALAAGKHVYCEWPLGVDTTEAEELRRLAESKGVRHVIGLQVRMSPALRHMRELVSNGSLGRIISASVRHSGGWTDHIPASMKYLQLAETGANIETIRGGHSIDALCYVAGELAEVSALRALQTPELTVVPDQTTAPRTAPDQILANGRFDSGATASIHIQGSPGRGSGFTLEVNGTKGDLLIVTNPGSSGVQMIESRLFRTDPASTELVELELPARYQDPDVDALPPAARNVARMYKAFAASLADPTIEVPDFNAAITRHRTLDLLRLSDARQARIKMGELES